MSRPTENWYRNRVIEIGRQRLGSLIGVEVEVTGAKRIDALFGYLDLSAPDPGLILTVVEVKRSEADSSALIQLMGYMGRLHTTLMGTGWWPISRVNGVLAAPQVSPSVIDALMYWAPQGRDLFTAWRITDNPDQPIFREPLEEWGRMQVAPDISRYGGEIRELLDHNFPGGVEVVRNARKSARTGRPGGKA